MGSNVLSLKLKLKIGSASGAADRTGFKLECSDPLKSEVKSGLRDYHIWSTSIDFFKLALDLAANFHYYAFSSEENYNWRIIQLHNKSVKIFTMNLKDFSSIITSCESVHPGKYYTVSYKSFLPPNINVIHYCIPVSRSKGAGKVTCTPLCASG